MRRRVRERGCRRNRRIGSVAPKKRRRGAWQFRRQSMPRRSHVIGRHIGQGDVRFSDRLSLDVGGQSPVRQYTTGQLAGIDEDNIGGAQLMRRVMGRRSTAAATAARKDEHRADDIEIRAERDGFGAAITGTASPQQMFRGDDRQDGLRIERAIFPMRDLQECPEPRDQGVQLLDGALIEQLRVGQEGITHQPIFPDSSSAPPTQRSSSQLTVFAPAGSSPSWICSPVQSATSTGSNRRIARVSAPLYVRSAVDARVSSDQSLMSVWRRLIGATRAIIHASTTRFICRSEPRSQALLVMVDVKLVTSSWATVSSSLSNVFGVPMVAAEAT